MKHTQVVYSSETSLVEAINKLSTQLSFSHEKKHFRHSCFLQEVIEDMELQLNMIRAGKGLIERRKITSFY
jgi:hypothetical protein